MIYLTMDVVDTKYRVKDGKLYYVRLLKPICASDPYCLHGKKDLTPYQNIRHVCYGVYVKNDDGYSWRPVDSQKERYTNAILAQKVFDVLCRFYQCTLSREEVRENDWRK